jgi:cytidine deaminase
VSKEGAGILQPSLDLPERQGPDAAYLHELDVLYGALSLMTVLVDTARKERKQSGVSYRRFTVGAAGSALDTTGSGLYVFAGANAKPQPHNETVCAEKRLLGRARKAPKARNAVSQGISYFPLIVVAGTTDKKQLQSVTGRPTHTLPPCQSNCVPMFRRSPLIDWRTIFVTIGHKKPEGDRYQVFTEEELEYFYQADPPTELTEIPYYDGHNGVWIEVLTAYTEASEKAKRARSIKPPAAQLALDALRLPARERHVILENTRKGLHYGVVSAHCSDTRPTRVPQ